MFLLWGSGIWWKCLRFRLGERPGGDHGVRRAGRTDPLVETFVAVVLILLTLY